MNTNFNKIVFDIVVVAGQSNAEGNGVSFDNKPLIISDAYEITGQTGLVGNLVIKLRVLVQRAASRGGAAFGVQVAVNLVEPVAVDVHPPVVVVELQTAGGRHLRGTGHVVVLPIDGALHLTVEVDTVFSVHRHMCAVGVAVVTPGAR